MYRWLLVAALFFIAGLLGTLLWATLNLVRDGIAIKFYVYTPSPLGVELTKPVQLAVRLEEPVVVKVAEFPLSFPSHLSVAVEGSLDAEMGILRCPRCREGTLIPVRVSLLGGAITWRCHSCGHEFSP